jgi:hypothetical protein
MAMANQSKAKNKVIILDSCHGGIAASNAVAKQVAEIPDGVTILTASTADQYAMETGGDSGVFTSLLVDALSGATANLVGAITPGSVYAHIDQSLGNWAQRPVFKTNVKKFVSLRETEAPIELADLQKLTTLFKDPATQLDLDPSYEPERSGGEDPLVPPPDPAHTAHFAVLQNLVKVNLVRPVNAPHMWHAAMKSTACELTVLGQHYWKLVKQNLIGCLPMTTSAKSYESDELMHRLATVEHERWAHWQQYVHDHGQRQDDGSLIIPAELVTRWDEQIAATYSDLSAKEQQSDREQVPVCASGKRWINSPRIVARRFLASRSWSLVVLRAALPNLTGLREGYARQDLIAPASLETRRPCLAAGSQHQACSRYHHCRPSATLTGGKRAHRMGRY